MRTAVVLFNLGGPDKPASVQPFLNNLFLDPAIISVPQPFRWLLAKFISTRRAPIAEKIYAEIGGKSPLLDLTIEQANALEKACEDFGNVKFFVCMRYWHPMSKEVVQQVKDFIPDQIVLLPLYPQFSTTTSGSSFDDWKRAAKFAGLTTKTIEVCCYPEIDGWIEAQADLVKKAIGKVTNGVSLRVLFSAHGLPKKVIEKGDPYQWQVEQTSQAVVNKLAIDNLDWVVCYQSQVGPLEWIGPSTDDEIDRAGKDSISIVVVPIAFVSEHSETLVELDIEYKELAEEKGVPEYIRVPAVGTHPSFISSLSALVRNACLKEIGIFSSTGSRICPESCGKCPW